MTFIAKKFKSPRKKSYNKGIASGRWKGGVKNKNCETCGVEYTPDGHLKRESKYCSVACGKIGELNPNWKGKASKKGEEHPSWKGDKVGIDALHTYMRNKVPNTGKCWDCGEEKRLDLANKSNEYKRDISDWEWLCRRCHMIKDGRMTNLINRNSGL